MMLVKMTALYLDVSMLVFQNVPSVAVGDIYLSNPNLQLEDLLICYSNKYYKDYLESNGIFKITEASPWLCVQMVLIHLLTTKYHTQCGLLC